MRTDRLSELSAQVVRLEAEIDAIKGKAQAEGRQMTDEERTKWSDLNKQYRAAIEEKRLEAEELENRSLADKAVVSAIKPQPVSEDDLQKRFPGLPPKNERFGNFGEFTRAVITAEPRMNGKIDPRLLRVATGMGESNPTDGGFLVQADQSARLIEPLFDPENGDQILRRVNLTNVTGNGLAFNAIDETSRASTNWGGIAVYWLGEGSQKTATSPKLRKVELKLKKVAGLMYLTDELLEDSPAVGGRMERGFRIALRSALHKAIIQGTGAGQPLGLLNSDAVITVAAETGQLANTIVPENIVNMYASLDPNAVSPVWLYNPACVKQLHLMQVATGTAGQLVNLPGGSLAFAPSQTLLGIPMVANPWCKNLGTEGDLILVDLGQYEFIQKGGPNVAYSIHLKFDYDETAMRIVYRCDGRPSVISATTLEDGSNTVSPIVTLATRS